MADQEVFEDTANTVDPAVFATLLSQLQGQLNAQYNSQSTETVANTVNTTIKLLFAFNKFLRMSDSIFVYIQLFARLFLSFTSCGKQKAILRANSSAKMK